MSSSLMAQWARPFSVRSLSTMASSTLLSAVFRFINTRPVNFLSTTVPCRTSVSKSCTRFQNPGYKVVCPYATEILDSPLARAVFPSSQKINEFYSYTPISIPDLLIHCYQFIHEHIIYKELDPSYKGIVVYEIPNGIPCFHNYIHKLNQLPSFHLIWMTRPFHDWAAALGSQLDARLEGSCFCPPISLSSLYSRYKSYHDSFTSLHAPPVNLSDLFLPNVLDFNSSLSSKLDVPTVDLTHLSFDLYGSLVPFNVAFTPADSSFSGSSPLTRWILLSYASHVQFLRQIMNIVFNLLRISGLARFRS